MVALKEEYTAHITVQAPDQTPVTVTLYPSGQTVWRRKHEIRAGGAPHLYAGAMMPELPPDDEVRVGYRNRVDDPSGAGYEYVGFAYRAWLRCPDLPQAVDVLEAHLLLYVDETVWQVQGQAAAQPVSAAGRLLVLEAPLQSGDAAFFTPTYTWCELPTAAGALERAAFSPAGELKIDVTAVVQAWVRGAAANHGFVLAGPSEAFEHNNDVQETTYGEALLVVRCR